MKRVLFLTAIILSLQTVAAQDISYKEYMERVLKDNIALTAKSLDLDIADATAESSKVFNDPTLAVSYTNNEDWSKGLGQGIEVELGKTFTFGVRRERMNMADSERKQAIALLEEYMRNFRAEATIAYLEHLRAGMIHDEAVEVYNGLSEVATNDSIRFIKGDIAESDWLESRMAQGVARNAVLEAEAELCNTAITMGYYMNSLCGAENLRGTGTLEISGQPAPIQEYIDNALERRPDIIVALERADMAKAKARFNKAQRRPELDVNIGATYNISNPDFTTLKAGIAVPLKFSSLNKGARIADETATYQAEIEVSEARLLVETEVMQAYRSFGFISKQAETFSSEMLNDMRKVVENKRKAYELGEIPFLDYLIVQRNENEMRHQYINALFNKAVAWVELQRSTGLDLQYGTKVIKE
ncbi:MAG: TolC family protein [Bacteroidaceae bacterium]|nr:TolC family protein [Bacteroidaceae bacterium]